ncbi:NDR1/HIN1-like protein 26 [Trifolium pratense]|uniref:NDR1/HIN1-like protein 26 n=1 Tax=Trifolium pratense TaxID=57577 RepID=UPI001E691264|nr:NDR1/HIN1-like protein 26 [Trifolium pratense]
MSQITIKSPKHCATKQVLRIERNYKKIFFAFSTFFTTILLLILLIYFILKPTKPQFSLQELDIYQLNLSGPILNSSIQLTLLSKNPNQKVSIYYDEFQLYATYKNQQITSDSFVPPFYQGQQESNLLSALLIGNGLPVAPSIGYELSHDQLSGRLSLNLKANGKLRWKIGTWVSGRYRFNVNCVSILAFGIGNSMNAPPLASKQGALCSTTI